MKNYKNIMLLNGEDIGISRIELDKSDLLVTDRSRKYCLKVYVNYNWKEIGNIKVGTKAKVDFNEYILSENGEPALIIPTRTYVEKMSDDVICFDLEFDGLSSMTCYMNKKEHFDIKLDSLKIKIYIDYRDARKGHIVYNF